MDGTDDTPNETGNLPPTNEEDELTHSEEQMDTRGNEEQPTTESESAIEFTHFDSVAQNDITSEQNSEVLHESGPKNVDANVEDNSEPMEDDSAVHDTEKTSAAEDTHNEERTDENSEPVDTNENDTENNVGNEENEDGQTKLSQLPISKIRKIMKIGLGDDGEVRIISKEAAFLVGQATELFVAAIAQETAKITQSCKKKTMTMQHLTTTITDSEIFSFLEGTMVPDYDF